MAVTAEEQTQLEHKISHNDIMCMNPLQRSQTFVLACLLFSETSEIILSTLEGVSIVILARLSIHFEFFSVLGIFTFSGHPFINQGRSG